MSSKLNSSEEQVTMSRSEYEEMVSGRKAAEDENADLRKIAVGTKLGSLVLLKNEKNELFWDNLIADKKATEKDREIKFIACGSFFIYEDFWDEVKRSIDADPLRRCQADFSMNESKFPSHDRLDDEFDANGEPNNNAPTFWMDTSSDMTLETLSQHIVRDPGTAYDMSKSRKASAVSELVHSRSKVA